MSFGWIVGVLAVSVGRGDVFGKRRFCGLRRHNQRMTNVTGAVDNEL